MSQSRNQRVLPVPWASPILRLAGSKRKLLPKLMMYVPHQYNRYIEPFAGSACLFFALRPQSAILGDFNEAIIQAYSVLRSHPTLVVRAAHRWKHSKRQYYSLRRVAPETLDEIERTARFIYLNRYCFNGVYRTNRLGQFNVPIGNRTGRLPAESAFYRCSIALRTARLRAVDFEVCLDDVRIRDFIYLDPPYTQSQRPTYGEYGYGTFNEGDIERLVTCLRRIDSIGAVFLLSYSDNSTLRKTLPKHWHCRKVRVRRHVAGFTQHRLRVSEILVSNRAPQQTR